MELMPPSQNRMVSDLMECNGCGNVFKDGIKFNGVMVVVMNSKMVSNLKVHC
jgi:uncharacterized Zn finger protein